MITSRRRVGEILLNAIICILFSLSVCAGTIDPKQYKPSGNALDGNVNRAQYIFYFCSDFRPENNNIRYIHFVVNRNKQQPLPAQWLKAGMDYQWVGEDAFWENDWAINQSNVGQDKSAKVEYGPKRPLKTAKAAVYEDQPKKPPQPKKSPGPPLASHLKGRVMVVKRGEAPNEKAKSMSFDITFQSQFSKGEFVYSVMNSGPQEIMIGIPKLSRTWAELIRGGKYSTTKAKQWREFKPKSLDKLGFPVFRMPTKEKQLSSYKTSAEHYEEAVTPIRVYALVEGQLVPVTSGRVTVYFPSNRND